MERYTLHRAASASGITPSGPGAASSALTHQRNSSAPWIWRLPPAAMAKTSPEPGAQRWMRVPLDPGEDQVVDPEGPAQSQCHHV